MRYFILLLFMPFLILSGETPAEKADYQMLKKSIVEKYKDKKPKVSGAYITGVKLKIDTKEKIMALTLDACGGPKGSKYDKELIDYLIEKKIPATLFINARWIDANPAIFAELAANPLFEIESHGLYHKPCVVTGNEHYGVKGTKDAGEVVDEVKLSAMKIEAVTGKKVLFYRPGTAVCDNVALAIVKELGYEAVSFNLFTYDFDQSSTAKKIADCLIKGTKPGAIILMHMNFPERNTLEGLKIAMPVIMSKGYKFILLRDYKDQLVGAGE
jgi:peptidoglycan/xylan/chitin deacetylase (PgdA/CDA1 family)